jgi:NitT/TauT family transport system permease protein
VSVDVEGAVAPVHADAEAERKAAPRAPRLVRRFWVQALSLAIFLGLWEYAGSTSNPVLFATPQNVVRAFVKLMGNGQLEHAFRIAVEDLAAGYSLSVVVGMLIGLAMGRSSVFSRAMSPYINFMPPR